MRMYEATKAQDFGGSVVALMNVGGVRATCSTPDLRR